jgi:hypothetical protein
MIFFIDWLLLLLSKISNIYKILNSLNIFIILITAFKKLRFFSVWEEFMDKNFLRQQFFKQIE